MMFSWTAEIFKIYKTIEDFFSIFEKKLFHIIFYSMAPRKQVVLEQFAELGSYLLYLSTKSVPV